MNNSYAWHNSVESVASWFSFELLTEPLNTIAIEGFNQLHLNTVDIILLFFKIYGVMLFYLIVSLIISLQLLFKFDFTYVKEREKFFVYWVFFLVSLILWISDNFLPLTSLSSGRLIALVNSTFPIFVGLGLYRLLKSKKLSLKSIHYNINPIFITIILIIVFLVGAFSLYPSPAVYTTNDAVDDPQIAGAIWFGEKESPASPIYNLGVIDTFRLQQALNGYSFYNFQYNIPVPDHFNYTDNNSLGNSFKQNSYLIYDEPFILSIYQKGGVFSKIDRFNLYDFQKLDNDSTVNKLYDNGETSVDMIK